MNADSVGQNVSRLEFRVLGPLEVLRNGEPIAITAPKQRTLLALLLLRHNEPVPQDALIDALWNGDVPRTARAAFQNLIYALRQALGSETLERQPTGYVLHSPPGTLDVERFRRLASEARGAPALERAAKLREALALWHGSAFPELSGDPSAQPEIARLEEERLSALEERIEMDLELGEHAAVIPELEELVARHPLRERFWAELMLALYRAGRQALALATYRRARESLVDELGIEPGGGLREMQRAILVQDRALDDPQQALGPTLERAAAILPREPRERVASLFEYGSALIRLGHLSQASSTLHAAGRLARAASERGLEERVRLLLSYLEVFAEGGSMAAHLAVAEDAARVFGDLGDNAAVALALSHQAHMLRDTGRGQCALAVARCGAQLAALAEDSACEAACRRMAATSAALGPTPVAEAMAICAAAESTDDERNPFSASDALVWLLAQSGRIAEARALYERMLRVLRERGLILHLIVGMAGAALAERAAGDLARAAAHFRTVYALGRAENVRGDLACEAGELACVLALQGDLDEAEPLADESRRLVARDDVLSEVLWRRAHALVAAHEGRHDEALRLSDEARARAERTDWLTIRGETLEEAALVRRLAGDDEGGSNALRAALTVYEQKGHLAGARRVRQSMRG
jgi:DNA-binding SARP family transcriptional activator